MQRPLSGPTVALAAVGLGLALLAATWHLGLEAGLVAESRGPVLAFLLDGLPPLGLVYGAYRLERSDLSAEDGWTVVRWTVAGALVFTLAIGLTMLVRQFEGRSLAEPAFELLVAADAGALSGAVAGYYSARARHDAARARRTRYALGFVNRLLRHDVRNDLNVVRGHAQDLAAYEGGDPGHVRETAAVVDRRAAAMNDLVDGTGAVAEALLGEAESRRIDLTAVVGDALDGVDTRDATVVTDLPERAPVAANGALRWVVENLVENGVEHGMPDRERPAAGAGPESASDEPAAVDGNGARSAAGPADLRIEVSVAVEDETVRLRVADDGVGVPDERKGEIFEPRAGTAHGGGLHLVSQLVSQFGGSIRVEDSDLGGAAFVVELPRAEAR